MCDTMVCMPSVTAGGKMLFAKNSDRDANEPHIIERHAAANYSKSHNNHVKTTYIEIPQVPHTYAVTLFKPSWIWGAEMGFNEYGVNIGNEAVFTKIKSSVPSLIGMDYLRLALERSKTACEAMQCITNLLEEYGQGGNCGYRKKFYYDNSYLIADGREAFVLETAGKYWAAVNVKDIYTISNNLSITNHFDYAHRHVWQLKKQNPGFSFSRHFSDPVFTFFSKASGRKLCSESMLRSQSGHITVETLMKVLRSHSGEISNKASVGSICMHSGGLIGDHTTGSYIAEYTADRPIYYATGSSLPCMSVFKPLLENAVKNDISGRGTAYWYERENLSRYFIAGQADVHTFRSKAAELETQMLHAVANTPPSELASIVRKFTSAESSLVTRELSLLEGRKHKFQLGRQYYRRFWTRKTEALQKEFPPLQ